MTPTQIHHILPFLKGLKSDRVFIKSFIFFVLLNTGIYLNIVTFHSIIPHGDSTAQMHHFLLDYRATHTPFSLLRSLNQTDAQWYIGIATHGYPTPPNNIYDFTDTSKFSSLAFAFFPVFPLLIALVNLAVHNIELSAFILNSLFLIAGFVSLYGLIRTFGYSAIISAKTCLFFFFYPFSFYFRSYFTEPLFLLLLIWFYYFFTQKKYIFAAVLLSVLTVTRGSIILFLPFFWLLTFQDTENLMKSLAIVTVTVLPLGAWSIFNFAQTGDPLYFLHIRDLWIPSDIPFRSSIIFNIAVIASFFDFPILFSTFNKTDILLIFAYGFLLLKSREVASKKIWISNIFLWLSPLIFASTMSFNRYLSVIFQPYLYIVKKFPDWLLSLTFVLQYIILNIFVLFFINGHWIG